MLKITLHNGLILEALLLKEYRCGKLFFLQDKLVITDNNNVEVGHRDLIDDVADLL